MHTLNLKCDKAPAFGPYFTFFTVVDDLEKGFLEVISLYPIFCVTQRF